MSNLLQITIDGTASSGKSTVAHNVAIQLGIEYISTGKIFRSYALAIKNIDPKDKEAVLHELKDVKFSYDEGHFYVNDLDVTSSLTSNTLSMPASIISAYPEVRKKYIKDIRKIIKHASIILDGRDIGTVVLPDAKYKFYLDAEPEVRAKRRALEIGAATSGPEFEKLLSEIIQRDKNDKSRKASPLRVPDGATVIDSSDMTVQEVVDLIVNKVRGK